MIGICEKTKSWISYCWLYGYKTNKIIYPLYNNGNAFTHIYTITFKRIMGISPSIAIMGFL